jgi:hypothetical protein
MLKIQQIVQISIISKHTLFKLPKYWINDKQWITCINIFLAFTKNIFSNNKLQ